MTPDCCTQAWAKATNHEIHNSEAMTGSRPEVVAWWKKTWWWTHPVHKSLEVPSPASAEWLADCVQAMATKGAAVSIQQHHENKDWIVEWGHWSDPHTYAIDRKTSPDLRRALCSALNGKPCERQAA